MGARSAERLVGPIDGHGPQRKRPATGGASLIAMPLAGRAGALKRHCRKEKLIHSNADLRFRFRCGGNSTSAGTHASIFASWCRFEWISIFTHHWRHSLLASVFADVPPAGNERRRRQRSACSWLCC